MYEYNHINIQKLASTTRASRDPIFLTMVKTGFRHRLLQEGKTMFSTPCSLTLKLYCAFNDTLKYFLLSIKLVLLPKTHFWVTDSWKEKYTDT
jgi:hypothetical protein